VGPRARRAVESCQRGATIGPARSRGQHTADQGLRACQRPGRQQAVGGTRLICGPWHGPQVAAWPADPSVLIDHHGKARTPPESQPRIGLTGALQNNCPSILSWPVPAEFFLFAHEALSVHRPGGLQRATRPLTGDADCTSRAFTFLSNCEAEVQRMRAWPNPALQLR
jgi:hypothetical protein